MLTIKDLKFSYQGNQKQSSHEKQEMCFNLKANKGEILSVIGSSGSGKTTLLHLIAGFIQPLSGSILVNDVDIAHRPTAKRPVTTVFQDHNLFPHLDVFTNIAIGINPSLKLNNKEKEQIHQAISKVGLSELYQRLPAQLSGGQRQRVALARTLVRKQQVLLLDEPLAALGPAMREEIIELIKSLVTKNKLIALFVTHQPQDALLASENLAFIHNGQVLEIGSCQSIFTNPKHKEMQQYLGKI